MAKNKAIVLFFIIFSFNKVFGQADRYVVYFMDKLNSPYTVEQPQDFLSQRAIERRAKYNIPIDETDFPVNPDYIAQIKPLSTNYYYSSRWFNVALIEATDAQVENIKALPIVKKVDYVAANGLDTKVGNPANRPKVSADLKKATNTSAYQNRILGVDLMHEAGFRGENILIGVFDGGFMNTDVLPFYSHIHSNNKIRYTYDFVRNNPYVFDYDRHGTEVLSCIGAYKEGEMEGTAYNADFILCITEEVATEYRVEEYNWLFAAEKADSIGVDIINSSLGYNTFSDGAMNYVYEDVDGQTAVISLASSKAAEKGIIVVSSAGNEGNKAWKYLTAPADAIGTLAVGAVNSSLYVASFSSVGPTADGRVKPDVVALGSSTVVGKIDGNIGLNNGTSFSSPQIAGLAAGILQSDPTLTVAEVIEKIRMSGTNAAGPNNQIGYGIPNFVRAQNKIILSVEENKLKNFRVYPNPVVAGELFIASENRSLQNLPLHVQIHAANGDLIMEKNVSLSNTKVASLNLSHLPSGLYAVSIISKKQTEKVKIIKN